ncbi:MAG: phosphodiester glycosidase family protein [Acidobacteria bacterium]|nr:phosphodiester glycosidase family protein [Acidobacteriota bacterium]
MRLRRLIALALTLWALTLTGAAQAPVTTRPFLGVTLSDVTVSEPRPARMLVAQVDLAAPGIRIAVSPPGGSREAVRETTLDFLARSGTQLAVNAHFFLPFPSDDLDAWLIGLAAADGRVYSAFETPVQDFALVADAPALRFDRRQRARIVHRRPGGDSRRVRERGDIWNAVAGSAQILTSGRVTIPGYRDAAHPDGALVPGPDGRYDSARSWYDLVTSRTVAGLSKNRRTLTLAVVDGKVGVAGLTPGEIATRLARDFGVWDAINLDGGGSTTMAWRDPATGQPALLNTPTGGARGRAVASSLAVFARPAPTP